jgi:plastocyanin
MKRTLIVLSIAGAALAAAPAQAGPRSKTAKVFDNFYLPTKATVKANTTVVWKWPADGGDVHDVKLKKGPKGAKKFHSQPASAGYTYKQTLKKPGTYSIVCTLHDEMKMTITVKK